ncbi:hypothetical protein FA10DRAFT_90505 [Acaromyces ingoldii]|uniref:Uncharacterized protein n=1 Tax=Acaromyces ingoldii TaxID=215250 RepID=A0A316YX03_9BASI|nr:hypothetical protein FA10DRAFT_90505 [Acaromyces ingoldii]PWN92335.1 hypothetical protein FA10DRAFT_90505 [Acaromyces ingoldii]
MSHERCALVRWALASLALHINKSTSTFRHPRTMKLTKHIFFAVAAVAIHASFTSSMQTSGTLQGKAIDAEIRESAVGPSVKDEGGTTSRSQTKGLFNFDSFSKWLPFKKVERKSRRPSGYSRYTWAQLSEDAKQNVIRLETGGLERPKDYSKRLWKTRNAAEQQSIHHFHNKQDKGTQERNKRLVRSFLWKSVS